ncbi:3-hydroxyacyl-ACP dehydratase FabZ family protein [Chitinophaga vietnamensis]|uniref:3-hydroxyacyl-ACP dehydratase FabZ family protein n=1 Tax=Chitinophaga vietnamensis TaxID=2593957 RepID=UPI001177F9C6|nr:3-hydroxyacyl-ACP dehydratase FabZ family protein [Chitinophaga vietnamensis]
MIATNFDNLNPVALLPHRAPMLLVDKVVHTDFDKSITVETTIDKDSFFMRGHFPGYPLLPGVIIIEMMFQACGILNRVSSSEQSQQEPRTRIGKAVKVKSAVFSKEVLPGSVLRITAEKVHSLFHFSEYKVTASVAGKNVCKAELTLSI